MADLQVQRLPRYARNDGLSVCHCNDAFLIMALCDSRPRAGVGWGLTNYFTPSSSFPKEGIAHTRLLFSIFQIHMVSRQKYLALAAKSVTKRLISRLLFKHLRSNEISKKSFLCSNCVAVFMKLFFNIR